MRQLRCRVRSQIRGLQCQGKFRALLLKLVQETDTNDSENPTEAVIDICDPTKDLWRAAIEKLDEKYLKKLQINGCEGQSPADIVDEIRLTLQHITRQREEHKQNSWKYRDETNKMLESVMKYKGLVDAGLKFDPTGYGEYVA